MSDEPPGAAVVLGSRTLGGATTRDLLASGWRVATVSGRRPDLRALEVEGAITICTDAADPEELGNALDGDVARHVEWTRALWAAMRPFSAGGVYVNFLGQEGSDRVLGAYRQEKFERLVALNRKYDPTNFFRINRNIPPPQPRASPRRRPRSRVEAKCSCAIEISLRSQRSPRSWR